MFRDLVLVPKVIKTGSSTRNSQDKCLISEIYDTVTMIDRWYTLKFALFL